MLGNASGTLRKIKIFITIITIFKSSCHEFGTSTRNFYGQMQFNMHTFLVLTTTAI